MKARRLAAIQLGSMVSLLSSLALEGCSTCDPDTEDCDSLFDDNFGGSSSGGSGTVQPTNSNMGGESNVEPPDSGEPEPLTCDPEEPDLSDCDICARTYCCTEVTDCSSNVTCSGEFTDAGTAAGEFGCIRDEAIAAAEDSFADYQTLEDARVTCAADSVTLTVAPETEALVSCLAGTETAPSPCVESCFEILPLN